MNRAAVAAVLVVLLTVQGSVAGVLTGDALSNGTGNDTTNETTVPASANATATANQSTTATSFVATAANEGEHPPTDATTTADGTETHTSTGTETSTATTERTESTTATPTETTTETATPTETTTETSTEVGTPTDTATDTATETDTATDTPAETDDTKTPTATDDPSTPTPTAETPARPPRTPPDGATPSPTSPAGGANASAPPSRAGSATPPAGAAGAAGGSAPSAGASARSARTGAASAGRTGARAAPSGAAPRGAAGGAGGAPSGAAGGAGAAAGAPSTASRAGAASGASAASAGGAASGSTGASPDAEFEVQSVSSDVAVGEPGTLTVTIENTGEDATDAVVDFQSQSSDLTFGQSSSTSRFVGDWEEGETRTLELTARAASTADTAEYPVQATVSYEDDDGNQSRSAPLTFGVTPDEPSSDLSVVSVSSDVPVGATGNVSVTLENTGEDATDAVVNLQSLSGDVLFGQTPNTTRFVGDWDAGETRTIEVTARAARTADTSEYPIRATVSYEDDDGNAARLGPATFGVTPEDEQQFTLGGVDSDLAAGAEGTISGTITNEGPERATDAVVVLSPNGSRAIAPRQSQYVLGDLDPGESESFAYPVFVNGSAEPGERQVSLVVQYYDSDGNPLQSKPLNAQVGIDAESDDFAVTDVDTDVEAGEQGTLSVTMTNTGENITDATVSFQSLSSGILFGRAANASRFIDDWDTGDRRTFEFDVTAADGTTDARYPLQASLSYDDVDGDRSRAGPIRFGVTPDEGEDDFAVVSATAEVQVGDEGPVSVTLENRGENVSEATVSLQSLTGDILFGRTANATQFIGEWPAGTQRTVTFNATASNRSETRSYPLQASVSYSDSDGDRGRAGPFTLGITPQPEQSFALANTSSTLSVGDEGNITGTITNQGPQGARNAVVRLVSRSQNIEPQATEVAVGSLSAGGTTNFSVPVAVTDSAEPGPQQFSFVVEYDNQNGEPRRSGTLSTQVDIGPQRDEFTVEPANASLDAGSSGTVTLNVTNNRASTVSNVNTKAFVDDPLSISTSEAYIAELRPNETQQIAFDVSSSGSASAGVYPLSVDFQYDTASGESKLSDTYEVPVELVAADDGGILSSLSVIWGLGALLVLFGIGVVWSRRR